MPELKNVFHAGKMNKDLDERLIPNGQYRDALNVDISFSESSDAGSAQNAYGNVVKSSVNISGAKCIGSVVDKENETIIWFICGTSVDAIAEYNPFTGEVTPILVDTNKTNASAFLNFSNDFLITGANVIDELLFFTDNNSEPKKVNISRMKNGSTNFSTTTKYQNSDGTYINDVYEELITVIKKYPLNAPNVKLESSIREGNVKGIARTSSNTSYVESSSISEADLNSQNILTSNVYASTSGGASILNITDVNYLQRVCNNYTDDAGNSIISFETTNFTTGSAYKKWRAIEPGMKVAISENGGTWSEPKRVHTVKTVDWLNHTITVDSNALITNPTNGTLVRIGHWSEPYNNDYFWAYTDASGNIIKKPIGTSSSVKTDLDGNVLKDGGVLGDGTGFDVSLTGSDASSGGTQLQYEAGWSYNAGTKTYIYDGTGGAEAIYPKITKGTDLLAGHTYQMKATITITTAGTIGFLSKKSNIGVASVDYSGINGVETERYAVGTHDINIKWKQNVTGNDGMLAIFAKSTTVGSVKINEITCLTKARPVRIQPVKFYGNTSYEVNDIVSLQADDVSAVNFDNDKFVDISLKLTKKIRKVNNKIISASHADAIGTGVTGNQKIANGDLSSLTTWHTGTSGTTDVGTSSAGFFVTGGALTSSNTQAGYIRNVLSESLVADEVYKLTYTVTTATTGSSGNKGILHLILATENRYTGDDIDKGHSNHILLPTDSTGTFSVYWKQKSIDRGAFSLTELMFYNDNDWSGAINNISVQKASGNTTTTCGVIGTNNNGRQVFEAEILSIDNSILSNLGGLKFTSKRLQPDAIYEKEFARFSYRYKYIDNEYSAISPFTEVCFLPKQDEGYKYDPKDGYNKSMINDVRKISLSGINSMPEDVKSIDILYKKSNATNVYIVRTIENKDFEELKLNDSIVITSEEIKSLLPENQMLRPYDNVPRKALSQEVTANRLMYGNYLQQYNYFNTPAEFKVQLNSFDTGGQALKSIKSIRDYQVGVVFLDSYGRQSPVFTDETGIIKLDQSKAKTSNRIQCSLTSPTPDWATHYKYYIKDSSSEYYNLAMDRFYSDVEDQNVWISFPSSEINKINENDYIVIKKEHDTENAVNVPAGATIKYKVLDKQAEPPKHIRFKMEEVGETSSQTTFSAGSVVDSTDSNAERNAKYDKQFSSYPVQGKGNFAISSFDLKEDAEFLDELESYITNTGVWYDLENRFIDIKSNLNGTVSEKYELTSIYKKTIVSKGVTAPKDSGATALGNVCIISNVTSSGSTITIGASSEGTSKSGGTGVIATSSLLSVGMRLVDSEKKGSLTKKGQVLIITKIDGTTITLSDSVSVTAEEELIFKDAADVYLFKTKKPFGADISFLGQSPQNTKIELLDIATLSYNSTTTVLPNPQDLKLIVKFYKQTTEDFGEEFKGKFFIKTKRDGTLNEFIYKSQSSINTFKSKDSAPIYYAQSWLLDQGNSDAIIEDTNLSTSSDYIKEILQIPINKNPYISTNFEGHDIISDLMSSLRAFGFQGDKYALVSGTENGNGLSLNPETHPNKVVDYAATALVNGVATRLRFGGVTRGIQNSSNYGTLKSINGYSMKEIDYATPFNSGGAANPSVCIDQSVGFRVIDETGSNIVGAVPYVGDGWQIGKTFCTFKFFGTAGFSANKGSLGNLYNFYKYLTTPGQTFRFTNDPTNTVYIIRKTETFKVANTRWGEDNAPQGLKTDDEGMLYYDPAVGVQVQLDKGIAWSPIEEADSQSLTSITSLELSTDSYSNTKTFTSAEEKLNKEKVAKSNASVFSACEIDFGEVVISSKTPAVFEVLPKDKIDLELFYETPTTKMIIKDGMSVKTSYRTANGENPLSLDAVVTKNLQSQGNVFQIKPQYVDHIVPAGETITIFKKDLNGNVVYEDNIVLTSSLVKGQGAQLTVAQNFQSINNVVYNIIDSSSTTQDIDYFNCFSFGNGVESNRLFDDYNAVTIDKGPRVSTILNTDYKEERKKNGLIYSGIYNSKSSFNNLNQFIQGEKITKDLNPDYGSIQKLFTRNTNVIVLCENKTLKVLANKDALFNADGNPQLTATNKVLGQVVPFVGEYGISTNPESFASYGYRCYYTDKKRGAVIRLSGDGITNISEKGMSKFFRENLDNSSNVLGSYDSLKSNYNVTLNGKTLSFTEKVNGWVSFKSFLPEDGVSLLNSYFTFKEGEIYMHNENLTRNNFYGNQHNSTIKLVFNGEPDTVKDFKTISYEGDTGWTANTITTDKESGSVPSFIEKEGKYFNFIKGAKINNDVDLLKTQGLNVQGVGKPSTITLNSNVRSFTHTVTAVDIASNIEPKKWIINNSTDSTATSKVIKFNEKAASNVTGKTVDFYIHPQKTKGISWKLAAEDFTFSLTEPVAISNFAGTVAATLHADGYIKVTITYVSNPFPSANTKTTLTITAGSAYQEQI